MERKNAATIQRLINSNDQDLESMKSTVSFEDDNAEGSQRNDDEKETFTWPEKAVLLFLELYRERENEFTSGLKRHNKLWSEIASELQQSNYNVSAVQVQNKMSSLKRTYKKIKDSNAKSGNHNSCWAFYSVMDSLFGEKSWVSPPAVASSDGPIAPSTFSSSSSSTCDSFSQSLSATDNFECQNSSSKPPKKRKVENILEAFISDLKSNREQNKEERKKEQLEKEEKKEQRWETYRAEKREMHKETSEIQRSLVHLLGKLVENIKK